MQSWYIDEILCQIISNESVNLHRLEHDRLVQKEHIEKTSEDIYEMVIQMVNILREERGKHPLLILYDPNSDDGWTDIGREAHQMRQNNISVCESMLSCQTYHSTMDDKDLAASNEPLPVTTRSCIELLWKLLEEH
jgi:hypothetical protein